MNKNLDKVIEDALKIAPTFQLGGDFKDRVTRLIRKNERRTQRKFYLLISMGVLLMFGVGLGMLEYFESMGVLSHLNQIVPVAVLLGGLVVMIQYLDKKLVKEKFFKQPA